jgi:hypothetical protein
MSSARKDLPAPDLSGTDPDETLRQRFSLGMPSAAPAAAPPGPYTGTGMYGQQQDAPAKDKRGRSKNKKEASPNTRPDPEGMRRVSYYVTAEAAAAIEQAVTEAELTLGGGIPKHVVMSALLLAGAERSAEIIAGLTRARADELAKRLEALRREAGDAEAGTETAE